MHGIKLENHSRRPMYLGLSPGLVHRLGREKAKIRERRVIDGSRILAQKKKAPPVPPAEDAFNAIGDAGKSETVQEALTQLGNDHLLGSDGGNERSVSM